MQLLELVNGRVYLTDKINARIFIIASTQVLCVNSIMYMSPILTYEISDKGTSAKRKYGLIIFFSFFPKKMHSANKTMTTILSTIKLLADIDSIDRKIAASTILFSLIDNNFIIPNKYYA